MSLLRPGLRVIRDNAKAYVIINLCYYGVVLLFMALVATQPQVQRSLVGAAGTSFSSSGTLGFVGQAYLSGNVALAALYTFLVNLFLGSLLYITLPSLFVPFAGLLMGLIRAVLWGLLLSPAMPELRLAMIPHSLTMLLEGQAYILAVLGAYSLWVTALRAGPDGGGFFARYWAGLKKNVRLYVLVVIVLLVAAVYEAAEVIYLVPLLSH
jgi:hypothetical protein